MIGLIVKSSNSERPFALDIEGELFIRKILFHQQVSEPPTRNGIYGIEHRYHVPVRSYSDIILLVKVSLKTPMQRFANIALKDEHRF
jgi:hypothetical protein